MKTNIIPLVFDNWSTEYQWFIPNSVPPDFIVDGKKIFPATHDIHYFDVPSIDVLKNTSIDVWTFPAKKWDVTYRHKNIKFMLRSDLLDNQSYLYPIFIGAFSYFNKHKNIKFDFVSNETLNDVRNKLAKIVLIHPFEGNSGHASHKDDFAILNDWCVDKGLTKEDVYFIHGNWKITEEILSYNFTYIPVHGFYSWIKTEVYDIIDYVPDENRYLFLTYNRRWDKHRHLLMLELFKFNILNLGLASFIGNNNIDKDLGNQNFNKLLLKERPDLLEVSEKFNKILPLTLDIANLQDINPVNDIVISHHQRTFLSIVTETLYGEGTYFFSEKTWKPILAGQPFILLSSVGSLSELRRQGYKTFDRWWNEDYDEEPSLVKRIGLILEELIKLSKLSKSNLVLMRKEMQDVLRHNQELFLINRKKYNDFSEATYCELVNIYNKL